MDTLDDMGVSKLSAKVFFKVIYSSTNLLEGLLKTKTHQLSFNFLIKRFIKRLD